MKTVEITLEELFWIMKQIHFMYPHPSKRDPIRVPKELWDKLELLVREYADPPWFDAGCPFKNFTIGGHAFYHQDNQPALDNAPDAE